MTLVRKESYWKVQLDAPLTDEDLLAIHTYHQNLKDAIYAIADALESGDVEGREAAYAKLVLAGKGEDVGLGGGAAGEDEEGTEEEGAGEPERDEGRGRVSPGGG